MVWWRYSEMSWSVDLIIWNGCCVFCLVICVWIKLRGKFVMMIYYVSKLFIGDEFLFDVYFSVDNGVFKCVEVYVDVVVLIGLVVLGFIDV